MADEQLIKPRELNPALAVYSDDAIMTDDGVTVSKATPVQIVDAGAPVASEAEAIAGTDNTKRMTPRGVQFAINSAAGGAVTRAQAWAESPDMPDPAIPGSKSSKTWALESEASAIRSADSAYLAASLSAGSPQSWAQFADFLEYADGKVVSFNGVMFVRDRSSSIADLPTGGGWRPLGTLSPRHYGAVGDGVTDDTEAFRAVYLRGGTIDIPKGRYSIHGLIRIVSNTRTIMSPDTILSYDNLGAGGTMFINGVWGSMDGPGGYDGVSNIEFNGGRITGEVRANTGLIVGFCSFSHGSRYRFTNVAFDHFAGNTHGLDMAGIRDVIFDGCTFKTWLQNGATLGQREFVNVDAATASSFPAFGPHDGTPSRDVLFICCEFDDVDVAAGFHPNVPVGSGPVSNVTFLDCTFKNTRSHMALFNYCDNIHFFNCKGVTTTGRGITLGNCSDSSAVGNNIKAPLFVLNFVGVTGTASYFTGAVISQNIIESTGVDSRCLSVNGAWQPRVVDNILITPAANAKGSASISLAGSVGVIAHGNTKRGAPASGATYSLITAPLAHNAPGSSSPLTQYNWATIDNTLIVLLDDDAACTVRTPGGNEDGNFFISAASGDPTQARGIVYLRNTDGTALKVADFAPGGDSFDVSPTALTGTSGADGRLSVSAVSTTSTGVANIENRTGSSRVITMSRM